jgi:hypothetical protein
MIDNYIGQWKINRMQMPNEFVRERIIDGIKVTLPEPPSRKDIMNSSLPVKKQKFTPPVVPSDKEFNEWSAEARRSFLVEEFEKRKNGVFFYNNGGIEYITGIHYFYLSYWRGEGVGLPEFRDSDRDFFYCWDAAEHDDNCYGLAYFTNRRSGKTMLSTNILYEFASRTKEVHCGIQSQTNRDGKNVFRKIVFSWKKLPSFWKPTDSGDKNPKETLRFEEPSTRSSKGDTKTYKNVLDSLIDYASSSETAYDGFKLSRYYCDEFGKFTEGDAYARWNIVKPCLRVGIRIIGKAIFTTTVEELEKGGGQSAYDIYLDSDPTDLGSDGRTRSGLWRLFKPSYYGFEGFINEYGYSQIEKAKKALLAEREGLEGKELAALTRKYPFNIKEAFQSSTTTNVFPVYKIIQQREFNEETKPVVRKGNFIWEDRENFKVSFKDDPNGKWEVSWLPDENNRNKFEMSRGIPNPLNTHMGAFGVDPFDHRTTVDEKRYSKGAMAGFRKYDPINPKNSNCFFLKYLERPPKETILYDDVAKTCVFYGMQVLPENNKPGIINWMLDNGFKNYIQRTKQSDYSKSTSRNYIYGVSMTGEMVREIAVGGLESYIYDFIGQITPDIQRTKFGIPERDIRPDMYGNCPFDDMLSDWEKFDSGKWTIYDMTVACMISKLAVTPVRNKQVNNEKEHKLSLTSFFKTHKI